MVNWFPDKAALKKPAFKSLAEQIANAIRLGLLEPGERLPPQREMAQSLQVSLQTVSRAYDELRRDNYIQGEIGRGTFVRARQRGEMTPFRSSPSNNSVVELSIYKPVLGELHERHMREALVQLGGDVPGDILFSFRPNQGHERHVKAGIEWLKLCGVEASRERLLITNGVTQATLTALFSVGKPGCTIVCESVGHHSLASLCASLGMRLLGLEIDTDGIVPESFETACAAGDVRALYLIPNLASPTLYLMSEERRKRIADIALKYNVFILENDVLGPLVTNKPPSFTELVPEMTYYMTSFTKCLMPGLRTGYMVIPHGHLQKVRGKQMITAWMATPLMAEIACRWVLDGTARKMILWQRNALQDRHRLATQVLGRWSIRSHSNALHIWLPLTGRWRADPFVAQAMEQRVAVAPSGPFIINDHLDVRAIRISLGAAPKTDLERGLHVIDQLLEREPEFTFDSF